jgi:hypothetical protein
MLLKRLRKEKSILMMKGELVKMTENNFEKLLGKNSDIFLVVNVTRKNG